MAAKLIALSVWAQRFDPSPHINTLRAWARDGKIIPVPVKIGRTYFVSPEARHIEELQRTMSLVDRIKAR